MILYETPSYGGHHFSLHLWNLSEQVKAPFKRPKWVDELHQKQKLVDLVTEPANLFCVFRPLAVVVSQDYSPFLCLFNSLSTGYSNIGN